MPTVRIASGLDIFYDEFGKKDAPALLLIMGLATQMTAWREPFCELLAASGLRVIRFDNRDIGLSSKMDQLGTPGLFDTLRAQLGLSIKTPYTLKDMAQDAKELLDALNIDQAHICGASLGGMIAQTFAIEYPKRTLSLTSIMSSTGSRRLPLPKIKIALKMAVLPAPKDERYIRFRANMFRDIGSINDLATDYDLLLEYSKQAWERSSYRTGYTRQLLAAMTAKSRTKQLSQTKQPTLVIHGAADPLMHVKGGKMTAACIPNARLEIIENMGHDLPAKLYDKVSKMIIENTLRPRFSTEPKC